MSSPFESVSSYRPLSTTFISVRTCCMGPYIFLNVFVGLFQVWNICLSSRLSLASIAVPGQKDYCLCRVAKVLFATSKCPSYWWIMSPRLSRSSCWLSNDHPKWHWQPPPSNRSTWPLCRVPQVSKQVRAYMSSCRNICIYLLTAISVTVVVRKWFNEWVENWQRGFLR